MTSTELTDYSPAPRRPEEQLREIVALSNEFGADPGFTRAGGGNSSAKVDGVLWIKPSGVSMATLTAGDLRALYERWCNDTGEDAMPPQALGRQLTGRGFTTRQVGRARTRTWFGITEIPGGERL